MSLSLLDWFAIFGYLGITLLLGLYFRRRSARSALAHSIELRGKL